MEDSRIKRINSEIQKVINETINHKLKDPRVSKDAIISVTSVDTAKDLSITKVYISIFNVEDEKEVMQGIESATGFIKNELAAKLDLRHTPDIKFIKDEGAKQADKIDRILKNLKSE